LLKYLPEVVTELQAAIENEVVEYIQFHNDRRDEDGQRLVEWNLNGAPGVGDRTSPGRPDVLGGRRSMAR